jgi:hypothetical protein
MRVTTFQEHPEITEKFDELRAALRAKGFAFGAMFVGFRREGKSQGMVILADNMPEYLQRHMLEDCKEGITKLLKCWRVQ